MKLLNLINALLWMLNALLWGAYANVPPMAACSLLAAAISIGMARMED